VPTLRFHQLVYTRAAIAASAAAFEGHAQVSVTEQDPYHEVELEVADPEATDELLGEFANYVLALTVEEKRKP